MKKKFSIYKAEWNYTREGSYKKDCVEIAFNRGYTIIERDSKIYKFEVEVETLLCEPDKTKTKWYETWQILKKLK